MGDDERTRIEPHQDLSQIEDGRLSVGAAANLGEYPKAWGNRDNVQCLL